MNVHCIIANGRVEIYRGRKMIGTVVAIGVDEPVITIFSSVDGVQELTFNDIAIIQDNWNQVAEIKPLRLYRCLACDQLWKAEQRINSRCGDACCQGTVKVEDTLPRTPSCRCKYCGNIETHLIIRKTSDPDEVVALCTCGMNFIVNVSTPSAEDIAQKFADRYVGY